MKVLITGATGFIGKAITLRLLDTPGNKINILTRDMGKAQKIFSHILVKCQENYQEKLQRLNFYFWQPETSLAPAAALEGVEGVINLLGENIAQRRWNAQQKRKIYSSRIIGTANLVKAINQMATAPKILTSTSAIGYYRLSKNPQDILDENSEKGSGFLAETCRDWEKEAQKAKCPVSIVRVGAPLGTAGGMLAKLLPIFRLGLGGKLGDGKQFLSWIHLQDLVEIYCLCLTDSRLQNQIVNATAPTPVTNLEFTKLLGKALDRPALFTVPPAILNLIAGEMGEVALNSQIVMPEKLQAMQFAFRYPSLDLAFSDLITKKSKR